MRSQNFIERAIKTISLHQRLIEPNADFFFQIMTQQSDRPLVLWRLPFLQHKN